MTPDRPAPEPADVLREAAMAAALHTATDNAGLACDGNHGKGWGSCQQQAIQLAARYVLAAKGAGPGDHHDSRGGNGHDAGTWDECWKCRHVRGAGAPPSPAIREAAERFASCMVPETDWQTHRADIRIAFGLAEPAPAEAGDLSGWVYSECSGLGHPAGPHWHPPVGQTPDVVNHD